MTENRYSLVWFYGCDIYSFMVDIYVAHTQIIRLQNLWWWLSEWWDCVNCTLKLHTRYVRDKHLQTTWQKYHLVEQKYDDKGRNSTYETAMLSCLLCQKTATKRSQHCYLAIHMSFMDSSTNINSCFFEVNIPNCSCSSLIPSVKVVLNLDCGLKTRTQTVSKFSASAVGKYIFQW